MAWIDDTAVSALLQQDLATDPYIGGLIDHAQALAEAEIGEQTDLTPPATGETPSAVQAVLAQIVARMWQAGQSARANPAALQSETTGPFTFQNPNAGAAGLGLTNRETRALRKAAGLVGVGTLPTTRGELETPAVIASTDYLDPTATDVFGDGSGWTHGGAPL